MENFGIRLIALGDGFGYGGQRVTWPVGHSRLVAGL